MRELIDSGGLAGGFGSGGGGGNGKLEAHTVATAACALGRTQHVTLGEQFLLDATSDEAVCCFNSTELHHAGFVVQPARAVRQHATVPLPGAWPPPVPVAWPRGPSGPCRPASSRSHLQRVHECACCPPSPQRRQCGPCVGRDGVTGLPFSELPTLLSQSIAPHGGFGLLSSQAFQRCGNLGKA